ncbi:MAG: YjbH domain-containing protein, partial [Alphaproteobacteria bacterium]|nr:YjbH domain-containing protein [Alphaproteobacteria bacterium]
PFVPPLRGSDPATRKAVAQRLFKELEDDGFRVDGLHLDNHRATIYVQPKRYPQQGRNIGRAARALANNVPPDIHHFTIVIVDSGVELGRTSILRSEFEGLLRRERSPEELLGTAIFEGSGAPVPADMVRNPNRYPNLDWGFAPRLRQHVGSGDQFYIYQFQAALEGRLDIAPGFNIEGEYARNVVDSFDRIRSQSDSQLPHVRSDIAMYLKEGENSLSKLQGNYLFIPGANLYGRASAGIFEEMYGGAGGEMLYRRVNTRWAVAGNFYRVRQRDYDQRFAFRDYETTTGHATLYYKAPYQDIVVALSAGKYLARDQGATLRFSRRFESGMEVGAWVTKTNVSAEQFGEGSFDKGFFLRIPFDLFTANNSTRRMGAFAFSPLTRDGGARLSVGPELYGLTEEVDVNNLTRTWHRVVN